MGPMSLTAALMVAMALLQTAVTADAAERVRRSATIRTGQEAIVDEAETPSSAPTSQQWMELAGENHWQGLLDPLDLNLRKTILSYGDLTEVTYDNYKYQLFFPFSVTTRFDLPTLFKDCGLANNSDSFPYSATKFIYATSSEGIPGAFTVPMQQSNWMGYVAVATDEGAKQLGRRDVVVAWRGTLQASEWAADFDYTMIPATSLVTGGQAPNVHRGFYSVYTTPNPTGGSARDQVSNEIRRIVEQYKNETISITVSGHSLGAALCTLSAWDIAQSGICGNCSVTGFPFASPRVGDASFQRAFNAVPNLRLLRITNRPDQVPMYPPPIAGYADVGENLEIDTTQSPYLIQPGDGYTWHDLECYMHGVAGTHGSTGGFKLEVPRDISYVNRFANALLPQYGVTPYWWYVQHGGAAVTDKAMPPMPGAATAKSQMPSFSRSSLLKA